MSYQSFLELRFIAERIKNRIVTALTLSKASWTPKLIETIPGKRFLVLAPHPDDDAIGCGGTISKLVESQKEVRICYLSIQSVKGIREEERMSEIENSLKKMGVTDYKFLAKKFPSLDNVPRIITEEISNYEPHAVFVPSPVENNEAHLKTFYSYLRSAKTNMNLKSDWLTVLYEIWNPLIPNVVIDITRYMPQKIQAIEAHKSQLAHLDFTRLAKGLNCYRSAIVSMNGYAEAFILLPRGDFVRLFMKRG